MLDKIKQLLNEEIIIPTIKFLSFSPAEIERWKDADCINIIRKKSDINNLMLEDLIKTEWNKIYKIVDIQLYNDLEDFPYLNTLESDEIQNLCEINETFVGIKLIRYVKSEVKRFFYDCEFDESPIYGIRLISLGMVDEFGNELYLINKDYDWNKCTNNWLIENVKPYIQSAPDFYKMNKSDMIRKILDFIKPSLKTDIKLYGYYSAYDHVCFSQIFGKMINLPEGLPMFTIDLKQTLDYFGIPHYSKLINPPENEHDALCDAKWNLKLYKAIKEKFGVNI
jgi:hypothetical protein